MPSYPAEQGVADVSIRPPPHVVLQIDARAPTSAEDDAARQDHSYDDDSPYAADFQYHTLDDGDVGDEDGDDEDDACDEGKEANSRYLQYLARAAASPTAAKQTSASATDDDSSSTPFVLPPKRARAKRAFSLPFLSPHRRLMVVVAVVNLSLLVPFVLLDWLHSPPIVAQLAVANLALAVLIRQQRVVNALFRLATATRTRLPLPARWMLAKIYHFGGVHSAAAVAAVVWLAVLSAALVVAHVAPASAEAPVPSVEAVVLTFVIDAMLAAIVVLALPPLRSHFHDLFERSHRFLGWASLALVWPHAVLLARDYTPQGVSVARHMFSSSTPYLLIAITISILSPWLTLRKVPVTISRPSTHAIVVSFPATSFQPFAGSSSALSLSPLLEWHSFANIVTPGVEGFRIVISRAGDWTSGVIDNPPTHFWLRGIPTAGVANIETLFSRIMYVATGSGIGPVLPHLLGQAVPSGLFWSARSARKTYGDELYDEIVGACDLAIVHDTAEHGKPNMFEAAFRAAKQFEAEAVIVISNPKVTRKVVYGMESRGIPAFGAIWDS